MHGLRERTVHHKDRFTVLKGQPRTGSAESRGHRFAGDHEPFGVYVMVDRDKSGEVVGNLGPQLLGNPYRPLRGCQGSENFCLRSVIEHEDDELPTWACKLASEMSALR